jgi:hypothetical protein
MFIQNVCAIEEYYGGIWQAEGTRYCMSIPEVGIAAVSHADDKVAGSTPTASETCSQKSKKKGVHSALKVSTPQVAAKQGTSV